MKRNEYIKLGSYIREVNIRNKDLKVELLLGVSIKKVLMPSIANTVGTKMHTYKIIQKHQFAYGPVTSRNGDKISIALLEEHKEAIVSQAYTVFEIIDKDLLDPEYLMMWFRRPEFDRYARYHSHGSARETFDWDSFCETELPIPSIEKQREIVAEYNTVQNRIQLNEQLIQKLEETAQTIYRKWFVEEQVEEWKTAQIKEFGQVVTGKTPSSKSPEDFGDYIPFITPGDFKNYHKFSLSADRKLSEVGLTKLKNKILSKGSIIVTCIGSDMGKIVVANEESITNQQMNSIVVNETYYTDYLYYHLNSVSEEKIKGVAMGSSTMPMLNKSDFEKIEIIKPHDRVLKKFEQSMVPVNGLIINSSKEAQKLRELKELLLSKMTKVEETTEKEVL